MDFLVITVTNIIWILYSMSEGIRESFFDYYQRFNKRICNFDVKRIFFIQRITVLILITIISFYKLGFISLLISLTHICMFKYFHKILYDISSKKLNGDIDNSKEHSFFKKMNVNKKSLLLIGILIQIFIYFFIV